MQNNCLYPIADAEKLVQGFTGCTLSKEEWTHEAHLVTGLFLLAQFGENAMDEMRAHLPRFNESVGGVNDDQHGYHETMTYFWLWLLKKKFADENGQVHWNQENLDTLLADESLADRNCWIHYYTEERMKSVAARRGFLRPDKMDFRENRFIH
ncbi:MAG: hypothetical protein H6577_25625 [Lewinellaceae bacterium]|nr:hypothetical protein [Saprospiraceae bacterium]MCB9341517.1 hypothetical protein [Lewinellaceae bacterium]